MNILIRKIAPPLLVLLALLSGCETGRRTTTAPAPETTVHFEPVSWSRLPGWKDDDTLAALDKLEQNGELYQREVIRVLSRDVPGETLEAWAYLHLGDATVFPLWPNDCWTGK